MNQDGRYAVARRLKERRLAAGIMTKAGAADALRIERSRYRNFEAAIRIPGYDMMKAIADLYDTDPAYLAGWVKKP